MKRIAAILVILLTASLNAFAQTDEVAEYNLGVDAFRAKDFAAARLHWGKVAAQSRSEAYNNLGFLLYNGLGGEADPVRAVALWRAAAEMRNEESQWHLALAYEEGKGTSGSLVEAYAWYRCAEAGYRVAPPIDEEDANIQRDASKSAVRVLARMQEKHRDAAERLAKIYTDLYLAKAR